MATYLLDTSVLIDTLNDKKGRPALLKELLKQGHLLACCAVNVAEVYAGMRKGEEFETGALVDSLVFLPIAREIARRAGLLKRDAAKQGTALSLADTMIAATAIAYDCVLLTDNVRHFQFPGLHLHSQ